MSVREPRWDTDWQIGRQGELLVEDTIRALRDGAPVEVKTDKRAAETGHLYIEYECVGKPSGINATEAPVWALVLEAGAIIFLPTATLRALARRAWMEERGSGHPYRVECRRGSHPTKGVLVPLGEIARWLAEASERQAA